MTKLALIEIDKKHDCPVGQYEKGCFDSEGSGQCLQCGMNKQRDSDQSVVDGLDAKITEQAAEIKKLEDIGCKTDGEIEQILAQAIGGFPWYKDDQKNFPNSTEKDGVCVGDHTPVTLAMTAAKVIVKQEAEIKRLKGIAIKVVEDEPEFPSEMPDALWLQMQLLHGKEDYTQLMRNVVSLTKTCIIKRLQAALASKEGEPLEAQEQPKQDGLEVKNELT